MSDAGDIYDDINKLGTLDDNWTHLRSVLASMVDLMNQVPMEDLDKKKKKKGWK